MLQNIRIFGNLILDYMYKLTFTLKQHTPLIHFQHDQDGATLRASEVKPKLDRFIIGILQKEMERESHRQFPRNTPEEEKSFLTAFKKKYPDYLVGGEKAEHLALHYQMRVEASERDPSFDALISVGIETNKEGKRKLKYKNLPNFFGNMMTIDQYDKGETIKKISFHKKINVYFILSSTTLKDKIEANISDFFLKHNFGTRQTKGFGSFSIDDKTTLLEKPFFFSLILGRGGFCELFEQIELFYKCLKSGLNIKTKDNGQIVDKLYYKSLMFQYAKSLSEQWDKRTIRHGHFLFHAKYNNEMANPKTGILNTRTSSETVTSSFSKPEERKYYDFRDLLGLSTEQDWLFYDKAKITKKVTFNQGEETIEIERFNSPITFKPIFDETKEQWIVYILLNEIPSLYLGANVEVKKMEVLLCI